MEIRSVFENSLQGGTPDKDTQNILEKLTLENYRIDLLKEIESPPTCVSIKTQFKDISLFTLGNFSLILGKAKSKKTFFTSLIVASMLQDEVFQDKFESNLPDNKRTVVIFDTEQSEYHVQKVAKRALKLTGQSENKNLEVYHLRTITTAERLRLIEEFIYSRDDVVIIIIDGIRDLITAINDEPESNMIKDKLLKWTAEKHIHIVVVLHQNKNDNNARGHVGTELVNKAETVISVTRDPKDKDISSVEAVHMRDIEFEPFAFQIDENGLPFILDSWDSSQESKNEKRNPHNEPFGTHQKVISSIFESVDELNYNDFVESVKQTLGAGANIAKTYIAYYIENRHINKKKRGNQTIYFMPKVRDY